MVFESSKRFSASLCLGVLCNLLLCSLPGTLRAEALAAVYSADFAVPSRDQAQLQQAQRAGLAEVLVKASGSVGAPDLPAAAEALAEAERFLLSYRYQQTASEELRLHLDFDEAAVQALLRKAGLPLWTAKRPTVLAWLVLSDQQGRRFVSPGELPDAQDALLSSFRRRGVPLQTPLYDLEDARAISAGAAWRQSSAALISASQRYRDTQVLAGRVVQLSSGEWTGDWRLLDDGRWITRSARGEDLAQFTDAGAALVAETLAARYAVSSQESRDQRHKVTLRGVRSYSDYRALQGVLSGLEAVQRVVPERLVGDQVTLRIDADADGQQLARIIELDGRFVPYAERNDGDGLYYEWIQ